MRSRGAKGLKGASEGRPNASAHAVRASPGAQDRTPDGSHASAESKDQGVYQNRNVHREGSVRNPPSVSSLNWVTLSSHQSGGNRHFKKPQSPQNPTAKLLPTSEPGRRSSGLPAFTVIGSFACVQGGREVGETAGSW